MVGLNHEEFSDQAAAISEPVGKLRTGRVQKQTRGFDRIAGDDDVFGALPAPLAFAMVFEARDPAVLPDLDTADHRQITNFGPGLDRPRDPGDKRTLLGIGRAAEFAEPAIDARMRL